MDVPGESDEAIRASLAPVVKLNAQLIRQAVPVLEIEAALSRMVQPIIGALGSYGDFALTAAWQQSIATQNTRRVVQIFENVTYPAIELHLARTVEPILRAVAAYGDFGIGASVLGSLSIHNAKILTDVVRNTQLTNQRLFENIVGVQTALSQALNWDIDWGIVQTAKFNVAALDVDIAAIADPDIAAEFEAFRDFSQHAASSAMDEQASNHVFDASEGELVFSGESSVRLWRQIRHFKVSGLSFTLAVAGGMVWFVVSYGGGGTSILDAGLQATAASVSGYYFWLKLVARD